MSTFGKVLLFFIVLAWAGFFVLVATAFALIYYFAPDVDQDFVFLTPGSVATTTLWLVGSLAFRVYVVNFGSYNATYGALGGVVVLLIWFYLTSFLLLVGAEINAVVAEKETGREAPAGGRQAVAAETQGAR